jgi:class 3 adenylate cyclase
MPIYLDRHFIEGATRHAITDAHERDLLIQEKHDVKFLTYWFDEERCTSFCLVDAPSKEAIQTAHDEAHGFVPHEIIEVDPSIVETFLGRISDPAPVDTSGTVAMDSAFRAIMFTDLKDSTRMTTDLGDTKALHLLHISNVLTRNALRVLGGTEIKHTGDGIMASFSSTRSAVECAREIQLAFHKHNMSEPAHPLHLKIGLSAGEPIEEHGDLFGTAVQLAARLCAHAEPNQILVSQIVQEECQPGQLPLSFYDEITLKGFEHPISVYNVDWQNS